MIANDADFSLLHLSWESPLTNADCLQHYVINITAAISYIITVTGTTYFLNATDVELDSCLLHTVYVAAVDGANRTGELSEEMSFIITGKFYYA